MNDHTMYAVSAAYYSATVQDEFFNGNGFLFKLVPIGLGGCSASILATLHPAVCCAHGFAFGALYSGLHLTSRMHDPEYNPLVALVKYALDVLISTFISWSVLSLFGATIPFPFAVKLGICTFPTTGLILLLAYTFFDIDPW